MSFQDYFDESSRTLMSFQYLEVGLKFYIRDCDRIIQKSVKDSFHYSVREKEIEKFPLGRLIDEFSRRSNRKDITSVLKKLNKHRNYLAHNAYILTIVEQDDPAMMTEYSKKIRKINKAANACLKELYKEHSRITKEPISEDILDMLNGVAM